MNRDDSIAMLWAPTLAKKDGSVWTEKSISDGLAYFGMKYNKAPTMILVRNPDKLAQWRESILGDFTIIASDTINDNYIVICTNREDYFTPKVDITYGGG